MFKLTFTDAPATIFVCVRTVGPDPQARSISTILTIFIRSVGVILISKTNGYIGYRIILC